MKRIIVAGLMMAFNFGAQAQKNVDKNLHFSVGAELAIATGEFSNTQSVGVGGTVQVSYRGFTLTDFTLSTGYISFAGKSAGSGIKYKGAGILPIKVGIKYYISEGFYGQAQSGVGIFSNNGGTTFAYSPVMGYEFDTKAGQAFDVSLKYDGYFKNSSNLGSVGLRLAYKF